VIDDATLMAYADGELDPAARAAVEAEVARSPETMRRLQAHAALRARMAEAFSSALDEPIPSALAALVAGAAPASAPVINLEDRRRSRAPAARRGLGLGLAASLVLGVLLGAGLMSTRGSGPIAAEGGQLVARGALAAALDRQLSSEAGPRQAVRVGLTIHTADGRYCRTFRLDQTAAVAGLACRGPSRWTVEVATAVAAERHTAYVTAATDIPDAVLQAVDRLADGPALNVASERAARAAGWAPRLSPK
jgi:hypothetical protein